MWKHGLCGCFDNCTICIITHFCPCYVAGKIADKVGESCCFHACLYFVPFVNIFCLVQTRGKVREVKHIEGSLVGDCCVMWFCHPLALCQEAQEVDALNQSYPEIQTEPAKELEIEIVRE